MRLITSLSTQPSTPGRAASALAHDAGPVVLGAWGLALLLRPSRPQSCRGDRVVVWYQREVALLNVSHLAQTLLCRRRTCGAPQVTLPAAALLLSAGHAAEAVRRRAPVHAVAAVAAAGWGLAGTHPKLTRRAGRRW